MKKHKLKLDELAVDSFETSAPSGGRGTVFGHESENTLCGLCSNSQGSPRYTGCDFSCEFECRDSENVCVSRDSCPPGGTGGTGGTGTGGVSAAYTNCDLSCDFAC